MFVANVKLFLDILVYLVILQDFKCRAALNYLPRHVATLAVNHYRTIAVSQCYRYSILDSEADCF